MKIFNMAQKFRKQFFNFLGKTRDTFVGFKLPPLRKRFSNALTLLKTGSCQIVHTPEIILISIFRLVMILWLFGLIAYNVLPICIILKMLHLGETVSSTLLLLFLCFLPLLYALAFIVGISSGAVGAASFLHQTHQGSSLIKCYQIALQNAGRLSTFIFLHYWVLQLISLHQKDSEFSGRILKFAWRVITFGVQPALLNGRDLQGAFQRTFQLFKGNKTEIITIQLAYSLILKILFLIILALLYIIMAPGISIIISLNIPTLTVWSIISFLGLIMILFMTINTIYISVVYHLYGNFLQKSKYPVTIERGEPASKSLIAVILIMLFYTGLPKMIYFLSLT